MDVEIKLTEKCRECNGTGNYHEWGKPEQTRGCKYGKTGDTIVFSVDGGCPRCDGTGEALTSLGAQILELVRDRLNRQAVPIPPKE
jgi:DnaJ-class molecular chaperone